LSLWTEFVEMVPLRMLFYLLLVLSLWCNPAESAGPWADDQPPLRLNEFERWVEKMAGESADDRWHAPRI